MTEKQSNIIGWVMVIGVILIVAVSIAYYYGKQQGFSNGYSDGQASGFEAGRTAGVNQMIEFEMNAHYVHTNAEAWKYINGTPLDDAWTNDYHITEVVCYPAISNSKLCKWCNATSGCTVINVTPIPITTVVSNGWVANVACGWNEGIWECRYCDVSGCGVLG